MENADLLKEYFLPYSFCANCLTRFYDSNENASDALVQHQKCIEHGQIFTNLFVEQHMIPIIMQQFLIDLRMNTSNLAPKTNEHSDKSSIVHNKIEPKEIEQFWNDYIQALPNDLGRIWDAIENGLVRYLQVIVHYYYAYFSSNCIINSLKLILLQILKRRKKLNNECNFLRQQNTEITHLLQQYANGNSIEY